MKNQILLTTLLSINALFCCTELFVFKKNVAAISARTMDFEIILNSNVALFYPEHDYKSQFITDAANIATWKTKHAYIGITGFNTNISVDGMNEKGLTASLLYLPDVTDYPSYDPDNKKPALGIMDVINYILGQYASVQEAIKGLEKVQLIATTYPLMNRFNDNKPFPLHIFIHDLEGNNAVIEFIDGTMHIHQSSDYTVLTNAPNFEWHVHNVKRYSKLQSDNRPDYTVDGLQMNGSGLVGLPGSFTSPSRFIRSTVLLRVMPEPTTYRQAMINAQSAIESVSVPLGTNPAPTLWTVIRDASKLRYSIKFHNKAFAQFTHYEFPKERTSKQPMKFLREQPAPSEAVIMRPDAD